MSYNTGRSTFRSGSQITKQILPRDVPADESPSRVWTESRHPPGARGLFRLDAAAGCCGLCAVRT
jgi:GH24 family phage-related lysozyme (muramidase)